VNDGEALKRAPFSTARVPFPQREILELRVPQTPGSEESLHSLGVSDLEIGDAFKGLRQSAPPRKSEG
jgi:hypothetical protein